MPRGGRGDAWRQQRNSSRPAAGQARPRRRRRRRRRPRRDGAALAAHPAFFRRRASRSWCAATRSRFPDHLRQVRGVGPAAGRPGRRSRPYLPTRAPRPTTVAGPAAPACATRAARRSCSRRPRIDAAKISPAVAGDRSPLHTARADFDKRPDMSSGGKAGVEVPSRNPARHIPIRPASPRPSQPRRLVVDRAAMRWAPSALVRGDAAEPRPLSDSTPIGEATPSDGVVRRSSGEEPGLATPFSLTAPLTRPTSGYDEIRDLAATARPRTAESVSR